MVRPVLLELVKQYEAELKAKCTKSKGKQQAAKIKAVPVKLPVLEASVISISSNSGSDDEKDGLVLAPLLIAQSQMLATGDEEIINLT